MANTATRLMTLDEFLAWDAPGPMPRQLFEGYPVAMAPPRHVHGTVVGNLARVIGNPLASRAPCRVVVEAGVTLPHRGRSYYVADLAVSCRQPDPDQIDIPDPLLIVEVLSPTTEEDDRKVKLPDYRRLPSVQEILYVDPARVYCELHRRMEGGRWETVILTDVAESLGLAVCDAAIPLRDVYANVALSDATRDTRIDTLR